MTTTIPIDPVTGGTLSSPDVAGETKPGTEATIGAAGGDAAAAQWHQTACILCECNCGIEVRLGDDRRTIERVRGDKAHPASQGYTCEKALRINHYQNGPHRLDTPMRRRPDGTYEPVDWDTAIADVAANFARVRDTYGGESIFYYGGGGQGNHLNGGYAAATRAVLGSKYKSNALGQEKLGEFWVNGRVVGNYTRGDFEHAEVSVWVGKNPYQSHGIAQARRTLKEIARDPNRTMVVIDPRRSETAELADYHLAVRPGTDAWCFAALAAVLLQEDLINRAWLAEHSTGLDELTPHLVSVDIDRYAAICDVDADLIRTVARRIGTASSVSVYEDLGVQMNLNSTLTSYLDKLLWALTGNFAVPGGHYIPAPIVALANNSPRGTDGSQRTRVTGTSIISGLVPGNVISEEILSDHPDRFRAMLVESANPAHSLADSPRMREALEALDYLVVIDVAMTETAQLADYVLPASSQYEKWEATFFNFEFPHNYFHLRRPMIEPLDGTLPEAEIHARIVEALGALDDLDLEPLHAAAQSGREAFGQAFMGFMAEHPDAAKVMPVILYRTLGPTLPDGAASAALLWGAVNIASLSIGPSIERAGFVGDGLALGDALFDAILKSSSGVIFSVDEPEVCWSRVQTPDGRINVAIPELFDALDGLATAKIPGSDPDFPLVLSAGERRSFTAVTIFRSPDWRKRDRDGGLRMSAADADALGLNDGDRALVTTARGSAEAVVEISPMMRAGHISLPNGYGVTELPTAERVGVPPNSLTSTSHRDPIAGTPYHKHVPARVEALR
ncbi:MAG: molybdopterin-dependent oxidoreductase [Actinobacteria bacterium]|nr:molybdopterin-dependent oxidoreductase [Actinomycetota bacterium]MCB9389959.1 molybdopterin-dependent oxidoreductase [Acidimicrobiia bacterium]